MSVSRGETAPIAYAPRFKRAPIVAFVALVAAHWAEHLVQAVQIYVLGMPRETSLGLIGSWFPEVVTSEWLHYLYNALFLGGLVLLRAGLAGRARVWWDVAIVIQIWHHVEHGLLLAQGVSGTNLLGAETPTSVLQLFFPRVELHLAYNLLATIPLVAALIVRTRTRALRTRSIGASPLEW